MSRPLSSLYASNTTGQVIVTDLSFSFGEYFNVSVSGLFFTLSPEPAASESNPVSFNCCLSPLNVLISLTSSSIFFLQTFLSSNYCLKMSGCAARRKFPCTFDDCPRLFTSVEEMKKHKESEPEHEYCSRCDEDFEDEERLLIHKLLTEKHIVCPICGIDFRSEGGRDGHIRQVGKSVQS